MANHRRKKRQTPRSSLNWMWLASGLFLGILSTAVLFIFLNNNKGHQQTTTPKLSRAEKTNKNTTKPHKATKKIASKKKPAQRFEFYQLLPGMEVPIPEKKTAQREPKRPSNINLPPIKQEKTKVTKQAPKPIPKPKPKVAKKPNTPSKPRASGVKIQKRIAAAQYLIQVGTYRDKKQAHALKTRLASQRFSSHIQKVETESGTWFRVTLGPFSTESAALRQKRRLEKQNIRAILLLQR